MSARLIRLRYAGRCAQCGGALPAAEQGWWSADDKTVRCQACGPPGVQSVYGIAGGSARAEHDRRERRREESIQAHRSRLVRFALRLQAEPQSTQAWAKGAVGEQRVGAYLETLTTSGAVVLHDLRIPGSRANIDHVVVTRSGVWVIDTKNYSGRVQQVDRGGWFSTDLRLYVGSNDRTKLVGAMSKQVAAVRGALADSDVPIRPVLCFTGAEWSMFAKPFALQGVVVTSTKPLLDMIQRADDRGVAVNAVSRRLAVNLRAAG